MPARAVAVHRNGIDVIGEVITGRVFPLRQKHDTEPEDVAAGDWLMVDPATRVPERILERRTLFRRKAAGMVQRLQPIAANIDTVFVV